MTLEGTQSKIKDMFVGYRRLYVAEGCELYSGEPIIQKFLLEDSTEATIYIGPRPLFGMWHHTVSDQFMIPGSQGPVIKQHNSHDPSHSEFEGKIFFEIIVLMKQGVVQEIFNKAKKENGAARESILDLAASDKEHWLNLISAISGIVGLRFHRQFVMRQINENPLIILGQKYFGRYHSGSLEVLETIELTDSAEPELSRLFLGLQLAKREQLEKIGAVLKWLERAWNEIDTIGKFIACFIPIECVLESVKIPMSKGEKTALREIGTLIRKSGGSKKDELLKVFDKYRQPRLPSLENRFQILAEDANYLSKEDDIATFSKFNKMRNNLIHRGDASANVIIHIDDDVIRSLEDIAERYVNYAIFRDHRVYLSRWRPHQNS